MQKLPLLSALFILCAFWASAQKPCDMKISVTSGCIPLPVQFTFSTTNTSSPKTYLWNFGDGDSSTQSNLTHIYKTHGTFYPTVSVTFANGTKCSVKSTLPVVIFASPVADFKFKDNQTIVLCSKASPVCFSDASKAGADGAPVKSWLWNFGDGGSSTTQNPCHLFPASGTYTVTQEVVDTNGCKNLVQKKITITYLSGSSVQLNPQFSMTVNASCTSDSVTVSFKNITDTSGKNITRFIWDFGDGTYDSCNLSVSGCLKKFLSQVHVYTGVNNTYYPSLYVENKQGCSDKYVGGGVAVRPKLTVNVKISPMPICFASGRTVNVSVNSRTGTTYSWDFGDPYNRGRDNLTSTKHVYKFPGIYTITLKVKSGTCEVDTIMCNAVKIYGPVAKIMTAKNGAWNVVPPAGNYLVPPSTYSTYFDTSCLGGLVTYYTYAPQFVANGKAVYSACQLDFKTQTLSADSLTACSGSKYPDTITNVSAHADHYKDTTQQVATAHIWAKGMAIPTGNVYSAGPFVPNPPNMDDTSLISIRCHAPFMVKFTNFSEKSRGYHAVDDYPLQYPDKCIHKAYPYASDSLQYSWDFGDGNPGAISTDAHPDSLAQYSTQKLPHHLYLKDGCYNVTLKVTDTITGCTDIDHTPVVVQEPDAGWDTALHLNNMTQLLQDSIGAGKYRRGIILDGQPCRFSQQNINLNETLPKCFKNSFAIVFDSAKEVRQCGKPPHIKFNWHYKPEVENTLKYTYRYADTGWKTIGLVISNNKFCTDTVWYHNYFYIHPINAIIVVTPPHICPGDTIKIAAVDQNQPGIKTFHLDYTYIPVGSSGPVYLPPDYFKFNLVKRQNGKTDTVTSTNNNPNLGPVDDPLKFNYLKDTMVKVINQAGHFSITSTMESRWGCIDANSVDVTIGHQASFTADNPVICEDNSVNFTGTAFYFAPFIQNNTGVDTVNYWQNPIGKRYGHKPAISEKMEWDFDGDGKIDASGTSASFYYSKPGSYTVTMYTTDSTGCRQKTIRKDYIKVVNAKARFGVAAPGPKRFCSGSHFFSFIDSSLVIKPFNDSLNLFHIAGWNWDFGDGTSSINITDSTRKNVGHVYLKNGDYKVTLKVYVSVPAGSTLPCSDTFTMTVHIVGPIAKFEIVGDNRGCVPFTMKVRDLSEKASIHEFLLGDGTAVSTHGDSIVYLTYKRPGIWCPQLFVADTLVDEQGMPLYCADTFPAKCDLKVYVDAINVQNLTASDTVICLGHTVDFKSLPDTGYKTWTINFGNGDSVTKTKPQFSVKYDSVGKYHVTVHGTGARCPVTTFLNVRVTDVKADFEVDTVPKDTPVFYMINHSVNAVRYAWNFGDGTPWYYTSSAERVRHEFQKSGKVTICLVAFNANGCADTVCRDIEIRIFLFIPNVFTPQGDAYNDHFVIVTYGCLAYDLTIYNRWGEEVFHSNRKDYTWDGKDQKTGKLFPEGTYYYNFKYRLIGEPNKIASGGCTLLRN